MFFVTEGIDGCGKTTQSGLLENALKEMGNDTIWTREPGGTPLAEHIRTLLITGDPDSMDRTTELLLFNASRNDHIQKVIQPSLNDGKMVVCDRYLGSTLAFQSYDVDLDPMVDNIISLHKTYCKLNPNITFWIDTEIDESVHRMTIVNKIDEMRFENKGDTFQNRVYNNYKKLYKNPKFGFLNIVRIDGNRPINEVAEDIKKKVKEYITRNEGNVQMIIA